LTNAKTAISPVFEFKMAETLLFFAFIGTKVSNFESNAMLPVLVKNLCWE
jgi:hypothetical protein